VQIVAKKDALVEYNFFVFEFPVGDGVSPPPFQGFLGIPEPSSLALAGLCLLTLRSTRRH
jgi:hypothetical protein